MKKLIGFLAVGIAFVACFYLFVSADNTKIAEPNQIKPNIQTASVSQTPSIKNKKLATNKVEELTVAIAQCKNNTFNFSEKVSDIHQELIHALEQGLKQGKTDRELLAYSNQYKTYYKGYDDLLLIAKMNIERHKYNYTTSPEILHKWNGLSVINGLSTKDIPNIVQGLKELEGKSAGLTMTLQLADNINKSDVYALLNNNDNFNTYLESPFAINDSPVISPSILFVLTATHLDFEEFKQAISFHKFNVNDVAIAIINDMPFEYLASLISQTDAIEDMPIIVQGDYDSYANLADLAASKHNVQLLKLLESHGVKGTNEAGIITAMDIAISNLPSDVTAYQDLDKFPQSYLDTLTYLHDKGYPAHGVSFQKDTGTDIFFTAPNRRNFHSSKVLEPKLKEFLYKIELIERGRGVSQTPSDQSMISNAIKTIEVKKKALNDKSKSCFDLKKELLAEEGFAPSKEVYETMDGINKLGNNIAQRLHEIDPALVNYWERTTNPYRISSDESKFIGLLQAEKYQLALDYSMTEPLTMGETERLLMSISKNIDSILPIWRARVSPQAPSGLLFFKNFKLAQWQIFMDDGFDFSIKDQLGNDIFLPAVLSSPEVVKLLLDNGYTPDVESLGLDSLDLLLEESYQKGQLNPNLALIIKEIKTFEPSHYSRIARIKQFYPDEYEKLIALNKDLIPKDGTKINRFRLNRY
jgi:hypothetical protein